MSTSSSAGSPLATHHAPNGMVCSVDFLASSAGVAVLRAGGSAVDAAVATSAVLAVTTPHMCGMGGDLFALVHDGSVAALDASGRAGSGADAGPPPVRGRHPHAAPRRHPLRPRAGMRRRVAGAPREIRSPRLGRRPRRRHRLCVGRVSGRRHAGVDVAAARRGGRRGRAVPAGRAPARPDRAATRRGAGPRGGRPIRSRRLLRGRVRRRSARGRSRRVHARRPGPPVGRLGDAAGSARLGRRRVDDPTGLPGLSHAGVVAHRRGPGAARTGRRPVVGPSAGRELSPGRLGPARPAPRRCRSRRAARPRRAGPAPSRHPARRRVAAHPSGRGRRHHPSGGGRPRSDGGVAHPVERERLRLPPVRAPHRASTCTTGASASRSPRDTRRSTAPVADRPTPWHPPWSRTPTGRCAPWSVRWAATRNPRS